MVEDIFANISPTALICEKIKSDYTRMPLASEVYRLALEGKEEREVLGENMLLEMERTSQTVLGRSEFSILEGRHIAINEAIKELDDHIIVELSAGLSLRKLDIPDRHYIETDLDGMVSLKKNIIAQLMKETDGLDYPIFALNPINIQELFDLGNKLRSERYNDGKAVTLVNTGLLMYLSYEDKLKLGKNIANFLKRYSPNGFWITTDLSSRPLDEDDKFLPIMNEIEKKSKTNFSRFESDEEVHAFLKQVGLKAEILPNEHIIDKLTCRDKLKLTKEEALRFAFRYRPWKMSLAQ